MEKQSKNIILKGIGGFYYVKTADGVLESKAKGIFRKNQLTPLAGDFVELETSNGDYVISEIHERKNFFLRPPAANIDLIFMIVSTIDPIPNYLVLDKLLAIAEQKGTDAVILITKSEIKPNKEIKKIYTRAGYKVIDVRKNFRKAKRKILKLMRHKTSLFVGNSGVGKSTLLNDLFGMNLETKETSQKLGRGKHTTRAVELYELGNGYVADSPGFSAVDIERAEYISKQDLQNLFFDIKSYIYSCQFRGCSHTSEKGCAVIDAVQKKKINPQRYESYKELYMKAQDLNDWEQKSKQ